MSTGFDISDRWKVGDLVDAADLNERLHTPMLYLVGKQAGQTEVDHEAEFAAGSLESTDAAALDLYAECDLSPDNEAELLWIADDASTPSSIDTGDAVTLEAWLRDTTGPTDEPLGQLRFERQAPEGEETAGRGLVEIRASAGGSFPATPAIQIDADGQVGIGGDAEADVQLRIRGTLNATEIRRQGSSMSDWTETLGSPDRVDWTGHAVAGGQLRSTVPTGTAPLVAASTTEATGLSVELLDGHGWKPGAASPVDSELVYLSTDSVDETITELEIPEAGEWLVFALVNIQVSYSDQGSTFTAKLKDDSDVQFGESAIVKTIGADYGWTGVTLLLRGQTTVASAGDTMKVTVQVDTTQDQDSAITADIVALWRAP